MGADHIDDEEEQLRAVALQNAKAILQARQRAERELARERERLRITLASIGDAVISTDLAGRVIFLNPVAEALTGWTQAEAAGKPLADVFRMVDEYARGPVENPALRAVRDGVVVGLANRTALLARDGTERPIDASAAPILDEAGELGGAVLVFRDVTERRRAAEAHARLAAIVESSEDAIVSKTLDGIIRTWNAGAERLFGYRPEEAIGRSITLIIPHERLDEEKAILSRLVRGERIESFETVRVAKDGRRLDISLTVSPLRDMDGRIVGASKIARDITFRKQAEERLARSLAREQEQGRMLRQVADASLTIHSASTLDHVLQAIADEARRIVGAERAYSTLTKGTDCNQTLVAAAPATAGPAPALDELAEAVCRSNRPQRLAGPELATAGSGPERPLRSWLAAPLVDHAGKNLGLVQLYDKPDGAFSESDEAVLMQLTHIASVAIENARLYTALREEDRRKDEFLALLAHELRNPLAPIRNGLQAMRLSPSESVRQRCQEVMERQLGHMVRLIDDLLDISRISRNKLELRRERVLLADVIESAIETARPLLEPVGHTFEVVLPPHPVVLDADLTRLAQVFSNLLTNSAKYTQPRGHIRLTAEQREGTAIVAVADNGIGIPRAALATIFDMFSQVDASFERSRGGLGIGLALVKGIVEMHGGTVVAESPGLGRGSTFTVRLPVAQTAPERPATSAEGAAPSVPARRILIVDDNEDSANTMSTMLRLLGHEVRAAYDGFEAVAAAEAFRPAVVLMDMGMPRLNGYDATRRIRAQPWGHDMLVIALTGWGQEDDRARTQEAGCDGHLVKPVALDELEQLLARLSTGRTRG